LQKFKYNNCRIDKIYSCFHHPDFNINCDCRKPKPGLILKAINEYNINIDDSWMIGDKITDIEAAHNAGINNRVLFTSKSNKLMNNNYNTAQSLLDIIEMYKKIYD